MRLSIAILVLIAAPAFAGTATYYDNDALGFSLMASPMSDTISICNKENQCLEFLPVEFDGTREPYELCPKMGACTEYLPAGPDDKVRRYRETSGKCHLELKHERLEYGGFMFRLSLQVVKVTRGSKNCVLGTRELWGIYQ